MNRPMTMIVAAGMLLAGDAAAQVDITRQIKRDDWTVYARRNIWNDRIDGVAMSQRATPPGADGPATIMLACSQAGPVIVITWPARLEVGPRGVAMMVRVGTESPRGSWWEPASTRNGSATLVNEELVLTGETAEAIETAMRGADRIAVGPGYAPGRSAVAISLKGLKAAWEDMKALCEGKLPPG